MASKVLLMIEDLKLLEELRIHNEVDCYIDSTSPDVHLPSLTYLKLEVRSSDGILNWMKLAPNLQGLYFRNTSSIRGSQPDRSSTDSNPSGVISLSALRCLHTGIFIPNTHYASSPSLAVTIFTHTACHALAELQVNLHSINCDEALLVFLRRSTPPLRRLALDVLICNRPRNNHRERLLVDALTLVPSVRSLCFQWEFNASYFPETVFQALAQTKKVLPALRHLELVNIVAPVERFLDVISARWRSERSSLKAFTLSGCFAKPFNSQPLACQRFEEFNYGDDPSKLPDTLKVLSKYMSEGLDYCSR
ncbi:hypothetical protein SCHPADRAFT_942279 [Schizopora paradoxa]|uniref:F-box domain-containing protein n=1 Tax=Schizopora paradoxa TaxID=27342 RepID=A0A0H2RH51_9AGAM|nr:hypothetical protein SCHPADRAFT_942279 [Schizopora paradoxa]